MNAHIVLEKGQRLWFTSDTHYNHKNICRSTTEWRTKDNKVPVNQTRDFKNLGHMNSTIVNNINSQVRHNDVLFHLGDWSFGGFEQIKNFRDNIVCKNVHLILGNHDHHIERNAEGIRDVFSSVSDYAVLTVTEDTDTYEFVLMHYPMCSWHGMNIGRFHLFGHVHMPENRKIMRGRSMDVGMDGNNMQPYEMNEVIRLLSDREIKTNSIHGDHHESE